MGFSEAFILNSVAIGIFPFVRISACLMSMFAFSSQNVPIVIRLTLALALTYNFLGNIPEPEVFEVFSIKGFITIAHEFLIGLGIGFVTQFISQIFVVAGQVVAMQTGLGFASLVDPVSGTNTPVVGQFFTVLTTILFFAVDGHLMLFRLLHYSFELVPINNTFPTLVWVEFAKFGSLMFIIALSLSISSICAMLLVNFTFGVMTRAAPQLNIFSLGFAISMLSGIVILRLVMSGFSIHFEEAMNQVFNLGCTFIGSECPNLF